MENEKSKLKPKDDKWLNTISIGLFVVGLLCVGYVLLSNIMKKRELTTQGNLNCVKDTILATVKDEHMANVIPPDSTVRILTNFYNCNDPRHGDLVWFQFSEHITPVARFVYGLPGDKYTLTEVPDKKGQWKIAINGQEITSDGVPYTIESNSVPPLRTYELSRGGVLKDDEYILLSGKAPGLSDSSNLGLIRKKNLIGKVILSK